MAASLPEAFVERMKFLLGAEFDDLPVGWGKWLDGILKKRRSSRLEVDLSA